MKEKEASKGFNRFNRSTEGLLLRQRRLAMTILGVFVVASAMFTGCGKTNSGNAMLPHAPYVIALSQPAGNLPGSLYALSPTAGTVQKLNLNVGLIPNSMLLDGNNLYVVNAGDATISVISITESTSNIYMNNNGYISLPPGSAPEYLTETTVNGVKTGYVTLNQINQVEVINMDKNTVLNDTPLSSYSTWASKFQTHPWGIAGVNNEIMVANNGMSYTDFTYASPGMISIIDPSTQAVTNNITTTGINLQAVEPLTQSGFVVISNGNYSTISGYAELYHDNFTERASIPLSGGGAGIALSSTGMGYVASSSIVGYDEIDTNAGTFVSTTDLTKQVKGLNGYNLTSIKFAPDGTLWASDWQDNMVFEIDPQTNTVIKTFSLPEHAQDMVFVY